ncbi:hypothetical protein ACUN9Y_11780 [Halomonas sp. V046]|uniref:hypothetical protein n=1 Tax=Halomonas sp. V046 TaxID=3459611 RepID=UPI004044F1DA
MLNIPIFVMIYAGVCISLYQLYAIYYHQNFGDQEKHDAEGTEQLEELSRQAKEYASTGASPGFLQTVKTVFGGDFDPRIAFVAFSGDGGERHAEPLLRRKHRLVCNGMIKIRHLALWKTRPPAWDIRAGLLMLIVLCSIVVVFLGGLSVYTIGYEVAATSLAWMNNEAILLGLIYALIVLTWLIAKFDLYMHDIYEIGKLNARFPPAAMTR